MKISKKDVWSILNNPCMCGSVNYKCTEFKDFCIILECLDCGRYNVLNKDRNGIQVWYDLGTVYFSEYQSRYPKFIVDKKTNKITQENGMHWFDRSKLERNVFMVKSSDVKNKYIELIKQYKQKVIYWEQKLKSLEKCENDTE